MRFDVIGAIIAIVMYGPPAHAQKDDELPPPQADVPEYAQNFSLEVEGALRMPDPRIVSRPIFDVDRSPHPDYPKDSLRSFEEGEVILGLCISDAGSVTKSMVVKSSSHPRLDAASLEWADTVVYAPAQTEEGPVAICGHFLAYHWKLARTRFPPFTPLANIGLIGVNPARFDYEKPMYPMLGEVEGVQPPKLTFAPPLPVYQEHLGEKPAPIPVTLCVAPQGRAVTVSGLDEVPAEPGGFALLWFNAMRFSPAMQNGKAIGVCGVEAELKWR